MSRPAKSRPFYIPVSNVSSKFRFSAKITTRISTFNQTLGFVAKLGQVCDFYRTFWLFSEFSIIDKFLFLTKILIFHQNIDFSPNFLTKILIFHQNIDFWQNFWQKFLFVKKKLYLWQNFLFVTKTCICDKNFYFWHKFWFSDKISTKGRFSPEIVIFFCNVKLRRKYGKQIYIK